MIPHWAAIDVCEHAKYLGVLVGRTASGKRWDDAIATYHKRVRLIASMRCGWGLSTVLYNILAASVTSYVAQFEAPPANLKNEERLAINRLYHLPNGSVPPSFFKNLGSAGNHACLIDISTAAAAARTRAFVRCGRGELLDNIINGAIDSIDRRYWVGADQWLKNSIWGQMKELANATLHQINLSEAIDRPAMQRLIHRTILPDFWTMAMGTLADKIPYCGDDPLHDMTARATYVLKTASKHLPLWAVAPLIRTMFAGWPLPGRLGDHQATCVMCGAAGPILHAHLAVCPAVVAWAECFDPAGTLDPNSPTTFGLDQPQCEHQVLAAALFWLSIYESWTFRKHGRASNTSVSTVRHRLRHMAVRDKRVASAIRAVRVAGFLPAG